MSEVRYHPMLRYLVITSLPRFLADRFVEGICPYCSYEVWDKILVIKKLNLHSSRTPVETNVMGAVEPWTLSS